jgi:hypothetical protein
MSLSTVWNPLSELDSAANLRLWTFYVSSKQNLGLRDGPEPVQAEREENVVGPIAAGSSIGAVLYRQAIRVYGITSYTVAGQTAPAYYLSQLSPTPRSLGVQTDCLRLAAVSETRPVGMDLKENAWIYFLRKDELAIWELAVDGHGPVQLETEAPPLGKKDGYSQLAAAYSKLNDTRYVVFQTSNMKLRYFDVKLADGYWIDLTLDARPATPLAICNYNIDENERTVIYYVRNQDSMLVKVTRIGNNRDWLHKVVDKFAPKVSSTSTLSVAVNLGTRANILTYSSEVSLASGIKEVIDPWGV